VRGIGRVFRGEGPEVDPSTQAPRSDDPYQGIPSGIP
jgi:hypothetical protein